MLVHRIVTHQQYVAGTHLYTRRRETKWSKVPCLRKQRDWRGLNLVPLDPEFEMLKSKTYLIPSSSTIIFSISSLSYFEIQNSSYVSGVSVCERLCGFVFVSLYLVRMFVARADKVEGTMSWCLGTNEILLKVEQGHFEAAILILHNFFVFYYGDGCLETLY